MILKGWTKPLPEWVIEKIKSGELVVIQEKNIEILHGKVTNPQGTVIEYK